MKRLLPLQLCAFVALCCFVDKASAASPTTVKEATIDEVANCRPLGQVLGESAMCSKTRAKRSATNQAEALGATHIVFVHLKCHIGVGEKATARIFSCSPTVSLEETYEDYLASDPALEGRTVPAQSAPRVMTSKNLDADAADLIRRGYALVGYAGVEGSKVPLDLVRSKAAAARAELALVQSLSAGEDVEYQSITTYSSGGARIGISSGTANVTSGQASATGSGFGTSIVSNPGSAATHYLPYAQRRFATQILVWRKLRSGPLGLITTLIPPELRSVYARNTGAYVVAVEDESPAFFANVLMGDVIVGIDAQEVRTPADLGQLVGQVAATSVTLTLIRDGNVVDVRVSK